MLAETQEWMIGAALLRPQGRRGEILVEPHTDLSTFIPGLTLWLATTEEAPPLSGGDHLLESVWQPTGKNAGRLVLKLSGIETISDAEAIAGKFLMLRANDLPPLPPDTFRVRDLVGCDLFDGDLRTGTVVDVQFPIAADGRTRLEDAPDLLAVDPSPILAGVQSLDEADEVEPTLVPFVRAWLLEVDIAGKRIVMNLPPGFFDEGESPEEALEEDSDTLDQAEA